MKFTFVHNNINVVDLERSIAFYTEALGLKVVGTHEADDGSFKLAFLEGEGSKQQLELTWLRDMDRAYNLGDNEIHMAFVTDDIDAALAKHRAMDAVVFENEDMGVYFIADPDGYWTEIIPERT